MWSKWQARREHDPTEGQDGVGAAAAARVVIGGGEDNNCGWPARRACRYGRCPGGKREETTATGDLWRFLLVVISVESSNFKIDLSDASSSKLSQKPWISRGIL